MMDGIVSTVGLLLIVVTVISAERRSKRRSRELCDRADSQIQALQHHASVRDRERVDHEPTPAEPVLPGK